MPRASFPEQRLSLLVNREAYEGLPDWLPSDAQLTQWVLASLSQSLPETTGEQLLEVSLVCVTRDQMHALNNQFRGKDSATNVLSFPADMPILPAEEHDQAETLVLGDVVVCPEVLSAEATQQKKPVEEHWAHMVVHSVLHLNGLDHQDEIAAHTMESLEIQILSTFGISNPYLAASAK